VSDGKLFDMPDPPRAASKPVDKVSADRARTDRQRKAIKAGHHPLGMRLHAQANRDATKDDPRNEPFTCGSCAHRILVNTGHAKTYPKCELVNTASAATDCRAWWPACTFYEPGDNALSPDAMRSIPPQEER
jgi:hypothetical protein